MRGDHTRLITGCNDEALNEAIIIIMHFPSIKSVHCKQGNLLIVDADIPCSSPVKLLWKTNDMSTAQPQISRNRQILP